MTTSDKKPPQFGLGGLFRVMVAVSLLLTAFTAELWLVALTTLVIGLFTLLWVVSLFKSH